MRSTLALALTAALLAAGCGSSGPTVAQRCHTYAVRHAGSLAEVVPVWEQLCNTHPKLLRGH